jgi:hypothetical protein
MAYDNPYITKNVYNRQRSGATGQKVFLPEKLYMNTIPGTRLPEYTGATTGRDVAQALSYQDVPVTDAGPGGDLGQAQGMQNSVESGVLSQEQADTIASGATSAAKGLMSMINPALAIMGDIATTKGHPTTPTGKLAYQALNAAGLTDPLSEIGETSEDAVNTALQASLPQSLNVDVDFPDMSDVNMPSFEAPPVSSMADMDFGGGIFGGGESPDAGVAAGIAAGFGGGDW